MDRESGDLDIAVSANRAFLGNGFLAKPFPAARENAIKAVAVRVPIVDFELLFFGPCSFMALTSGREMAPLWARRAGTSMHSGAMSYPQGLKEKSEGNRQKAKHLQLKVGVSRRLGLG